MVVSGGCGSDETATQSIFNTAAPTETDAATFFPSPSSMTALTPTATLTTGPSFTPTITNQPEFAFAVNADMKGFAGPGEYDTPQYFRGMVEAVAGLDEAEFLISVGDISPLEESKWTIDQYLGADFLWFPVVGNHDVWERDMEWLRSYDYDPNGELPPNIVNYGPEGCEQTTFSFDYMNAHFIILNVYCDLGNETRTDGAIVDALYDWLVEDFEGTEKEHIFVFGHEPAYPQPDADNGIIRHLDESLDKYPYTRDRFWKLLSESDVIAYITGHTHSYSHVEIEDVWQIDVGHSMGARTQATLSTFVMIHVLGSAVWIETYRASTIEEIYTLRHSGYLRE